MKKTLSLAAIAALTGAGLTLAFTTPSTPSPSVLQDDEAEVAARLERKARKAMELSGGADQGKMIVDQMMASFAALPGLPPGFAEKFSQMVKPQDFIELVVPIWTRHLGEKELDGLIAFYTSPAGKAFLKAQPVIAQESMAAGQKWGQEVAMEVMRELERNDD